ncbi:MAG TPA: B12-binding domain-containing radical SAM protein [Xanthobacteraceae bacterium]|nr:B12-binding domain-containing radical SAM protein [Xanthobacteraceae bacterium]
MRSAVSVRHERRVLCVFPAYTPSFGTFQHAFALMGRVRAFMPPQGLLLIAAYMPRSWPVRFIDENITPATDADFAWADVVLVSGMHIQAPQIRDICVRAHAAGKVAALGGPSVSGAPEMYPDFDYLHVGELGDATDDLIGRLDASVARPGKQIVLETQERLGLDAFPLPAYDMIPLARYLIGSLQFSSGCPYRCEFCDIPGLYGRQPRLKSPAQLTSELEAMLRQPARPLVIYFVDDNFIGNKKAARDMLHHLIAWQKQNYYPFAFACEATLNLAKQTEILALMHEAGFCEVFVGIETPEPDALKGMKKDQNLMVPLLESVATMNRHGLEVTAGMIIGLDTDKPDTDQHIIDFIDQSNIPILTLNLLQALPKTPLWDRLAAAGRLVDDPALESNVRFLRPHDDVVASWRRCIAHAYEPRRLFERYMHQVEATYPNRFQPPARGRLNWPGLKLGATLAWNVARRVGWQSDYRGEFWGAAWKALKRGQIEAVLGMGFTSHHLIEFSRQALRGEQNASFYSAKAREPGDTPAPAEAAA